MVSIHFNPAGKGPTNGLKGIPKQQKIKFYNLSALDFMQPSDFKHPSFCAVRESIKKASGEISIFSGKSINIPMLQTQIDPQIPLFIFKEKLTEREKLSLRKAGFQLVVHTPPTEYPLPEEESITTKILLTLGVKQINFLKEDGTRRDVNLHGPDVKAIKEARAIEQIRTALKRIYGKNIENESIILNWFNEQSQKGRDTEEMLQMLENPYNEETQKLISVVVTSLTDFFRDEFREGFWIKCLPKKLDGMIKEKISKKDKTIKIWIAGCSTGEEAYTTTAILHYIFEENKINIEEWEIEIIGTDICQKSLDIATEGKYSRRSSPIDKVILDEFSKYFPNYDSKSNIFSVAKEIKNLVKFKLLNLLDFQGMKDFDLILSINTLKKTLKYLEGRGEEVAKRLYESLAENGILIINEDLNIFGITPETYGICEKYSIYQRR